MEIPDDEFADVFHSDGNQSFDLDGPHQYRQFGADDLKRLRPMNAHTDHLRLSEPLFGWW